MIAVPIDVTRDPSRDLTTHVVIGPVPEEEMYTVLEGFYADQPTTRLLWDMSRAEMEHVTPEMLRRFISKAAELGVKRPGGRTAVIAPKDLQFALGRMSETFMDFESAPFSFRVFRSAADALSWLVSDDPS